MLPGRRRPWPPRVSFAPALAQPRLQEALVPPIGEWHQKRRPGSRARSVPRGGVTSRSSLQTCACPHARPRSRPVPRSLRAGAGMRERAGSDGAPTPADSEGARLALSPPGSQACSLTGRHLPLSAQMAYSFSPRIKAHFFFIFGNQSRLFSSPAPTPVRCKPNGSFHLWFHRVTAKIPLFRVA